MVSSLQSMTIPYNPLKHSIYDTIQKYRFINNKGAKSLGQHFLCDENLLDKIAKSATPINSHTTIVEVGAGPCGLTRSLLKLFPDNEIICIEKDVRFKPLHDEILRHSKYLKFVYADALSYDLNFGEIAIISNLPYNVGTLLLIGWLTQYIHNIEKMVLLFQKEVAERICAKVGTKQYGSISILAQLLCDVELLFDISNKAFIPSPKVTSSLVLLIPKLKHTSDLLCAFGKFVNTCFQFRRKMIGAILKKLYFALDIDKILALLNIDKTYRPENISPHKFWQLYVAITKRASCPSTIL